MVFDCKPIVDAVIESLKDGNELFPDRIWYFPPEGRSEREDERQRVRISDQHSAYAYIEPVPVDTAVGQGIMKGMYTVSRRFKLIADCMECKRTNLLNFCFNAVQATAGAVILTIGDDSSRIYFEETGEEPQTKTNLIRITFNAVLPAQNCYIGPGVTNQNTLCLTSDC